NALVLVNPTVHRAPVAPATAGDDTTDTADTADTDVVVELPLIEDQSCEPGAVFGYRATASNTPYAGPFIVADRWVDANAVGLSYTNVSYTLATPGGAPFILSLDGRGPLPRFAVGERGTLVVATDPGLPRPYLVALFAEDGQLRYMSYEVDTAGDLPNATDCGGLPCPRVALADRPPCAVEDNGCVITTGFVSVDLPTARFIASPGRTLEEGEGRLTVDTVRQRSQCSLAGVRVSLRYALPERSDCRCLTSDACPTDTVCDSFDGLSAGRCRPELACDASCPEGDCDPLTGACVAPDATACDDEGRCSAGICNPFTASCVPFDFVACITAPRCSYLTGPAECLVDCDCHGGACVDGHCASCDEARLGLAQDDPDGADLVEVCVAADPLAQAAVSALYPGMVCGFGSTFTTCDAATQVSCYGPLGDGASPVPDATWERLCLLSVHPLVADIATGSLE
ncbi:MAG: hypothetical protein KC635_12120, partial [Myxococcales bacterium]|nr:hypothetical protein [Myxococcales bacterium]